MRKASTERLLASYYRWAAEEWCDPAKLQFYLEEVKGTPTLDFLDFLDSLVPAEKRVAVKGVIKSGHRQALRLLRETLSPAEAQYAEAFARYRRVVLPNGTKMRGAPGARLSAAQARFLELGAPSESQLQEAVVAGVQQLLGTAYSKSRDSRVIFRTAVSKLTLETWFDFASRVHLRYGHNLLGEADAFLLSNVSICSWLGVFRETWWNLATHGDEARSSAAVASLCKSFLAFCQTFASEEEAKG